MSKYDRLGAWLREQSLREIPITFSEIERILGFKLPESQKHQAWWSNSTSNNTMTQVWLDAGYRTEQVDVAGRKLVFRRISTAKPVSPEKAHSNEMKDEARMFKHQEKAKVPGRHPLIGAMKGTFTIEPGWDLTRPALDPEELAEWEASLERKADMIEQGLARKRK